MRFLPVILACLLGSILLPSCVSSDSDAPKSDSNAHRGRAPNVESDVKWKPFAFPLEKGKAAFLVVSHRGTLPGSAQTENSLGSVLEVAGSADAIEFDLQLTKDGRLILLHDETLERVTTCRGRVDERTWEDLQANCRLKSGAPITLYDQEFIGEVAGRFKYVFAEIKPRKRVTEVLAGVEALPRPPNLIYTSYRIPMVEALIARGIPATFDAFTIKAVRRAHRLGMPVAMADFRDMDAAAAAEVIGLVKSKQLGLVLYTVERRDQNLHRLEMLVRAGVVAAVLFDDPAYGRELERRWRN